MTAVSLPIKVVPFGEVQTKGMFILANEASLATIPLQYPDMLPIVMRKIGPDPEFNWVPVFDIHINNGRERLTGGRLADDQLCILVR